MRQTGKRAAIGVVAGGAWIGWAGSATHAFALPVWVVLVLTECTLLAVCAYCIVKGKKEPKRASGVNRGFLLVLMLEAVGVSAVIGITQRTGRFDVLPDWIGMIIGLHFVALGKVLRTPVYYATGTAITLWCLLAWGFFHGSALTVAAGLGVGAILWATSSFNLLRVLGERP